jgi:hypothetical protein
MPGEEDAKASLPSEPLANAMAYSMRHHHQLPLKKLLRLAT